MLRRMGIGMDMLSARSADATASDGQLLARIARGDQDAVTALYRRLERPLFAFLVKTLQDREAAADVLNETMLDVWRQAGRFEGKSSVATWIYSIAHHKAISWLRKRREVELDEEAVAGIPDDAPAADSKLAAADLSELIGRLMEKLSVDHRIVLQLAYFQEFTVGQIAEILDCPENTVKTRMFYARQRLRALLESEGIQGAAA
jgi:RNA polymerase sigma-70 factor (ECF subfamily)